MLHMHLSFHLHIHHFLWFLEAITADVCLRVDLCCCCERCCKRNVCVQMQEGMNTMIKADVCLSHVLYSR